MIKYKKIEISDIPELADLYMETFNSAPWNDEWTKKTAEKRLHQMVCVEDFYGLCAYQDDKLCGMILGCMEQFFDGVMFNIREFCVKNGLRGKGLGTEIFKRFESDLKDKGVRELILFTARGEYTEHFYHKQNLHNIESLVLMGKEL